MASVGAGADVSDGRPSMEKKEAAEARTVDLVLDSTLESVDTAEEAALREAQELGFDEDDLHRIGMSVRECMVNAVVHGNRYNARKKVHFTVSRTPDRSKTTRSRLSRKRSTRASARTPK